MSAVSRRVGSTVLCIGIAVVPCSLRAATLRVDAGHKIGTIRSIHGVNGGPICYGAFVDLSQYYKALGIPLTRVHDVNWAVRDAVDIHAIFPDFRADPDSPASYHFAPTDDYLKSILATGSQVIYRLGESIENTPPRYYVHRPADYDRWARICLGIIRHYNEGWADGFKLDLRYFEIWNEPEIGPAQWDGTAEDYYRLYATTARAIKARWPALRVGGPAAGSLGQLEGNKLTPSPFLQGFLAYCRKESVPVDFLSWHMYTADATAPVRATRGLRAVLDGFGMQRTEIHLNEWNYLPADDFDPTFKFNGRALQKWCDELGGVRGAAFITCVLLGLQDAPLDMGNFYTGENGIWGLFNFFGVPKKTYHAFRAVKAIVDHPLRVAVEGDKPGELAAVAGITADSDELAIVVSNYNSADRRVRVSLENLPWRGASVCEFLVLDEKHDLKRVRTQSAEGSRIQLLQDLPAPGVLLVYVREAAKGVRDEGTAGGADLTVTKTHEGNFFRGQTGAKYTITVTNVGDEPTSGSLVVVSDTVPAGLAPTAISGTEWYCAQPSGPCTRNNVLASLASYPLLTLTVNVAADAPASVTNSVAVRGGGETNAANNTATDPTTINP